MSPELEMKASSYLYELPSSEILHIDDLLDFSNDEIFDTDAGDTHFTLPESITGNGISAGDTDEKSHRSDFSDDLCVPTDDVAQLEWLSKFVDESFSEYPFPAGGNHHAGTPNSPPDPSVPGRARTKRYRASAHTNSWSSSDISIATTAKAKEKRAVQQSVSGCRKCTHCLTEKTPQWRMGPTGPKTLCNACGVRYKSGRLVPEYRPAASPTFVLTQHSNSHRKVMELRRQKEILRQVESFHDFQVC